MKTMPAKSSALSAVPEGNDQSPFQEALAEAYRSGDPNIEAWKGETMQFVAEIAPRWFGTLTEGNLRDAMRAVDRFLSMGILYATLRAKKRPGNFIDSLRTSGIGGLADITTNLLTIIGELPAEPTTARPPIDACRNREELARRCLAERSANAALEFLLGALTERSQFKGKATTPENSFQNDTRQIV